MSENPGIEKIGDLLKNVDNGSFVIPYFQRKFEWWPSMVCDLVESILQKYYTGLILLWELNPKNAKNEKWEPVYGADLKEDPKKAILDGQQRLASLYYAIYNPRKTFPCRSSYYLFYVNIISVLNDKYEDALLYSRSRKHMDWEHIHQKREDWIKTGSFPLALLSANDPTATNQKYVDSNEFDDLLNEFITNRLSELPSDIRVSKILKIFNGILNYPFVSFPLSHNRTLTDICNIFARVNAKGMRLSTFDLMNAFLYPKDVKLRVELWEGLDNEILKSIDSNMNEYLLKTISLIKQSYCSSKYIFNLIPGEKIRKKDQHGNMLQEILINDGREFNDLWNKACKFCEKARVKIMNTGRNDFGAIKTSFIPNNTLIPVLGAILWKYSNNTNDPEFTAELNKWYWTAVFSEDYSGSSDSVMAKDFRDWLEWINTGKEVKRIEKIKINNIDELDLKSTWKGSAVYNAILGILALNNSRDFCTERSVGSGDYSNENINDHHIFPIKVKGLDTEKSKTFNDMKNSIVNRTLLLDECNNKIKNKLPSSYVQELINKHGSEKRVIDILESHLISERAYEYIKDDNFDDFIIEREKIIKEHIIAKLNLKK